MVDAVSAASGINEVTAEEAQTELDRLRDAEGRAFYAYSRAPKDDQELFERYVVANQNLIEFARLVWEKFTKEEVQ